MHKKNPNKKCGSILVYCVIILAMMLVIASGMSFVTTSEKKDATTTQASAQAIQTADSGMQLAIKKLTSASGTIGSALSSIGSCDYSTGKIITSADAAAGPTGSTYALTFFDGTTPTPVQLACSDDVSKIVNIKSTGTYKNTVRAVSTELSGGACPSTVTANGVTYGTVTAEDGNCWLDRNLGATSTNNDSTGYGWYFQWGRGADGHQLSSPGTAVGPSANCTSVDAPGNANFILLPGTGASSNGDWCWPQNDGLWQKGTEINNPCPTGFRVPTENEWANLLSNIPALSSCSSNSSCLTVAYNSDLKLTAAGLRDYLQVVGDGVLMNGTTGMGIYWSSDIQSGSGGGADDFGFAAGGVTSQSTDTAPRAEGLPVRCIAN